MSSLVRPQASVLSSRLREPRRSIQVIAGPRQVGKSTLLAQCLGELDRRHHSASADAPEAQSTTWIRQQWEVGRALARDDKRRGAVLALDEIQKVPRWSEAVKALWDEDTRSQLKLRVVLLGSAPLLVQSGLDESLAGRFELIRMQQWSLSEMGAAFRTSLDAYVYFGGYPGAAPLVTDLPRWRAYVRDSLIETSIARDILQMTRVDKPALLRRLFELGCAYSGQELSYTKMLGQLQDAGNTVTLSAYGRLLSGAGLLTPLEKYAGQKVRQRASSPKWLVHDTALVSAPLGLTLAQARKDTALWGRLVESSVGAHLLHGARDEGFEIFYWRDGDAEVDFVVKRADRVTAIEVKSGRLRSGVRGGLGEFERAFSPARVLLVGEGGISIEAFLGKPASHWIA
jgi:hypothetical protein